MDAIKTYVDNVFAAFAQTSEVLALKRDMLANMEEKYVVLRQSGKSEHEAAYSVIANFGSIDEITNELGLGVKNEAPDNSIFLSWDEVKIYLARQKRAAIGIALGVWMIIAGVSTVVAFGSVFIMFLAIAAAVTMFIIIGGSLHVYESFSENPIHFETHTREMIRDERAAFAPRSTAMIAIGVALIILTVGAFTVMHVPVPFFLNVVGLSVFLFVVSGCYIAALDVLLGKGDYANKVAIQKAGRIIGTIACVYWPVAAAIYLFWSFTSDAWALSWIIWPVAGSIFGAIAASISVWFGTQTGETE